MPLPNEIDFFMKCNVSIPKTIFFSTGYSDTF